MMFLISGTMQFVFLIIFLRISIIQTLDYDIDNQQTCTHTPFNADFPHNCSRTRLIQDVNIPNTDQILYITIIFNTTSSINTTFTITKSSEYNQIIYFTFFTITGRYMFINNKTQLILNDTTINSYIYDPLSELAIEAISPYLIPEAYLLGNPYCILKQNSFLPLSTNITRIYYLYTNATDLNLDLSISTYRISPIFTYFNNCFTLETSLTTLAIVLIVIVSVLSFATLVLIGICLKKQLTTLYHFWTNHVRAKLGLPPTVIIHAKPSS